MSIPLVRARASAALVIAVCAAAGSAVPAIARAQSTPGAQVPAADSVVRGYTQADVNFMTGMIAHHAQALIMSRWAPTHGASPELLTLTSRIINSQQDEIQTMQRWLRDHGKPVPQGSAQHLTMGMMMPGMLTDRQMAQLDSSRGPEFDRMFLRLMIQHHTGALTMVDTLFAKYGAAQEDLVYKIASEIQSDQTTEIARMQKMLTALVIDQLKSEGSTDSTR